MNWTKKNIGLYFAASSSVMCKIYTPMIAETYKELATKGVNDFEIILISHDEDEKSFQEHFMTMPWLAFPYSNHKTRDRLKSLFAVESTPGLIILNEKGIVVNGKGLLVVHKYGSNGYPFTSERIKQLKDELEAQKKKQSFETVLATPSRDFAISNDGNEVMWKSQVPISELEGKMVGLYMSLGSFRSCQNFTPKLIDFYKSLKEKGESFEIILVSIDDDKESFQKQFVNIPWLAIPFGDKALEKLPEYFELRAIPTMVILGPDGKTLHLNARGYVEEFGIQAYPFSAEKFSELEEIKKAQRVSQTLESLLVSDELDFVIGKNNIKVPVSELVGKIVLFFFSRKQCPQCKVFTPKLAKTYNEIKANHPDFEVIYVSLDNDEESFHDYYSEMPWLSLPYNDKREVPLRQSFEFSGIPHLVAVGPTGKTLTNEAKDLVVFFGSEAYPFTDGKKKELEGRLEEMAKGWPEKLRNKRHAYHELVLTRCGVYACDGCRELGVGWSFDCDECYFNLHPECALMDEKSVGGDDENGEQNNIVVEANNEDEAAGSERWICDGQVCYKA